MGAWGAGNFENDMALDFVYMLQNTDDLKLIENVADRILNTDLTDDHNYLDADDATEIIVAGEVIALLEGKPASKLPEDLTDWQQKHTLTVAPELRQRVLQALKLAFADSELRELWEEGGVESEDFLEWEANVNELIIRLESLAGSG